MAIKITVAKKASFRVKGSFNDETGKPQPFNFGLLCKRLETEELKEKTKGEIDLIEFMLDVTESWEDVKTDDNKPLEYSEDAMRELMKQPGLAWLTYRTYLTETGAKEKN